MKAYGLHGYNSWGDQDWALKGRAREATKREIKAELEDSNFVGKEVPLCIWCALSGKICKDCEYWIDVIGEYDRAL